MIKKKRMNNLKTSIIVMGLFASLFASLIVVSYDAWSQAGGAAAAALNVPKYVELRVNTATISITPTQAEIDADSVEKLGILSVDVRTNNAAGCTIKVKCEAAGASKINPTDFFIKSGTTGSAITAYATVSTIDQNLWSNSNTKALFSIAPSPILIDAKIQNLLNYAGGTYTNTLTFTAVMN